jgi:hypothetical protein
MQAVRRRAAAPPSYPTPHIYGAILALRRDGRRVENYCRDRRLHVIGNAILDEETLLARAAEVGYSRAKRSSTSRLAHTPDVKPVRA